MSTKKIQIIMPIGMNHGWGICGRYLTRELARYCDVELMTGNFSMDDVMDEEEFNHLSSLRKDKHQALKDSEKLEYPVLQAIRGLDMDPWHQTIQSPFRIGYTFFEKDSIQPEAIKRAKGYFDMIIAGSSWCERILNKHGFKKTKTIIQGIDPSLFHANNNEKTLYQDQFVIFSGGKLELRKGQDLMIRAFKIMQDKYSDVMLVNLWYNQWSSSMEPMALSPYIRFEMPKGDPLASINRLLVLNGIDPRRVITLSPKSNHEMAAIYKNTDLGVFPNRCEGGTNLVLMEYMACGKPVIASYSSGHRDILSDHNSIPVKTLHPFVVRDQDNRVLYNWDEPNLDEIVSALEWAYWHRAELKAIGRTAGQDLSKLTWSRSAKKFYETFNGSVAGCHPNALPLQGDHSQYLNPSNQNADAIMTDHEKMLFEFLNSPQHEGPITLRDMMKQLRIQCGEFSKTEAILHMMEALIIESTKRRGW